jgi:hypothetical protein
MTPHFTPKPNSFQKNTAPYNVECQETNRNRRNGTTPQKLASDRPLTLFLIGDAIEKD